MVDAHPGPRAARGAAVPSLSLGALILLAVGFRLPAFFLLRYGGTAPDWSDFLYYHELAALAAQGYLPDLHFWVEYPPLFPWLAVGAYRLGLLLPSWTQPYFWFDLILTVVLALADVGSLLVIDRLGDLIGGDGWGRRSATLYAALFLPVYAILGWFDTLPVFFLLLGVYLALPRRPDARPAPRALALAGAAIGLGIMLKLFPVLALAAVIVAVVPRAGRRGAALPVLATAATVALIGIPFYILGRGTFLATFQNVLARGSWTSPWAILDGYYGPGTVASLPDRLFYNPSALWGQSTHYAWLWWLAVLLAGAIYLWRGRVALRSATPRAAVALTGLGITLLLLVSRGFSTQFTMWLLPFAALLLPDLAGAIFAVALTLNDVVLEGFLYVSLFPDLHRLLWVSVAVRTVLLLWFAVECGAAVDPKAGARLAARRRRLAYPALAAAGVGLVAAAALVGPPLGRAIAARNGDDAVLAALRRADPAAVVFTQPETYDRLAADVRPRPALVLAQPKLLEWTGDRSLDGRLTAGVGGASSVLLVTDTAQPTAKVLPAVREWLGARFGAEPEQKVGSLSFVVFRASLRPAEKPIGARFGPAIDLVGYQPPDLVGHPGAPLAVTLHWRAIAPIPRDYSVSVQLLDPAGKLAAQHDGMPAGNARPTSTWRPGEDVLDPVALALPTQLASGRYTLIVVVYDHQSLQRLNAAGQDHATLGTVAVR